MAYFEGFSSLFSISPAVGLVNESLRDTTILGFAAMLRFQCASRLYNRRGLPLERVIRNGTRVATRICSPGQRLWAGKEKRGKEGTKV